MFFEWFSFCVQNVLWGTKCWLNFNLRDGRKYLGGSGTVKVVNTRNTYLK